MDVGSAENAWSNFQPTHMDVGSAENAWSNFQPTYTDVGSADIAGAYICRPCRLDIRILAADGLEQGHPFHLSC